MHAVLRTTVIFFLYSGLCAQNGVVRVESAFGYGTGIAIGENRVLTVSHLFGSTPTAGSQAIHVMVFDDDQVRLLQADIVKQKQLSDDGDGLTLLAVRGKIKSTRKVSSRALIFGEPIFVMGYPILADGYLFVTAGIFSGFLTPYLSMTDIHVGQGMSGGPILNNRGEVSGIMASFRQDMIGFQISYFFHVTNKLLKTYGLTR